MELNLLSNVVTINQQTVMPPMDMVLSKLGGRGFQILREVYNDPFVFGAVNSRKSGVLLRDWNVRGDGADEVMEWLGKLPVNDIIERVLDAVFFGFQVFEINWNEKLQPIEVIQRPPELFRLRNDEIIYVGGGRDEVFPKEKFIYVTFGKNLKEIYGTAILSKVYYYWFFLKEVTRLWVRFIEKFGLPFTEVKAVASEEEQQQIANRVSNAISNAVLVHDPAVEVNFLDPSSKDTAVFTGMIEHCKNAISQAILGHERGTQSTAGKLGNEQMALMVREDIIKQDCRLVERFFDTLIGYYWNLRYETEQPYFYFVEDEDLQMERAKRDQILAQIGVVFSPSYWKKQYNLGDDDVLFESEEPKAVQICDETISEAIENDYIGFSDLTKKIMKKLKEGKDFNDVYELIKELSGDLTFKELEQKVEKLLNWAYLRGRDESQI